jgi:telomere length regulation protein
VNLVHAFIALNDNYETPGFVEKRQAVLNALVACCPRKAAPWVFAIWFIHDRTV